MIAINTVKFTNLVQFMTMQFAMWNKLIKKNWLYFINFIILIGPIVLALTKINKLKDAVRVLISFSEGFHYFLKMYLVYINKTVSRTNSPTDYYYKINWI
jgi:hypothetical protein